MTDYTPTTEATKRAYVTGVRQTFFATGAELAEEFDRWLAAHDAEVAAKAWDEGHLTHGRWIPTDGACRISGGCVATNPYRASRYSAGSDNARAELGEQAIAEIHRAWRTLPLERSHARIGEILKSWRHADADIRFRNTEPTE